MKKLILLSLITSLFFACNTSDEEKAKNLVKEYLNKNLNDPKSYEEVSWGKLDSSFITFDEMYAIELARSKRLAEDAKSELETGDINLGNEYKRSYDSLNLVLENLQKEFKPKFNSLMIHHTYRGKNALGAVVIQEKTFYISDDLSKVISMN
jgi:hypothetical protein